MALPANQQVLVTPEALALAPDPAGDSWVLGREFRAVNGSIISPAMVAACGCGVPWRWICRGGQRGHLSLQAGERALLFQAGVELEALSAQGR